MMMMKTEIHSDCLKMQTKQQQQQIADIDNQSDQLIFLETNKTKQKTSSLFTNNLYIFFHFLVHFLTKVPDLSRCMCGKKIQEPNNEQQQQQ